MMYNSPPSDAIAIHARVVMNRVEAKVIIEDVRKRLPSDVLVRRMEELDVDLSFEHLHPLLRDIDDKTFSTWMDQTTRAVKIRPALNE